MLIGFIEYAGRRSFYFKNHAIWVPMNAINRVSMVPQKKKDRNKVEHALDSNYLNILNISSLNSETTLISNKNFSVRKNCPFLYIMHVMHTFSKIVRKGRKYSNLLSSNNFDGLDHALFKMSLNRNQSEPEWISLRKIWLSWSSIFFY